MTKTITKKPIIATIAVTILLGTILIVSNTLTNNVVAQTALPSSPCPPDGEVQHWDKIVFQITGDKSKTIPKNMLKKTLDLKILDTPEEIVDLEQEVKNAVGIKFGVDPSDVKIRIKDVLYQTVSCAGSGISDPVSLDVLQVSKVEFVQNTNFISVSATCPPDRVLVGGGGDYFTQEDLSFFSLEPDESTPNTFNATVSMRGATTGSILATSVAFCAKLIP